MNNKHEGMIRGFYWSSKAYYNHVLDKPEIIFGMYEPDGEGGTTGEALAVWHDLGNEVAPRIEIFDDSWSLFSEFPDLFMALSEHEEKTVSEEKFVEILRGCGFKDLTKYERE